MNFITFLKSLPKQADKSSHNFIRFALSDKEFPDTADPEQLARYLYLRLDHKQTLAYQKLLMFYFFSENNFQQPTDPSLLGKINLIVSLQNGDPLYRNIELN